MLLGWRPHLLSTQRKGFHSFLSSGSSISVCSGVFGVSRKAFETPLVLIVLFNDQVHSKQFRLFVPGCFL